MPSPRRNAAIAAAATSCLMLALPHVASAQMGDVPIAVLGIEAIDAPEATAAEITDALRQRIAATKGFQLIPGKDLVEVKLVFSCPDEAPSCMAVAGKSLGATKLLFGTLKKKGTDYEVSLKLLDTYKSTVDTWVTEPLAHRQATGAALRPPVQKWFATLVGQNTMGSIRVRANVTGASISLDGTLVGTTRPQDVTLEASAGTHQLRLEKPGFQTIQQDVNVSAGDTASVSLRLAEVPRTPDATGFAAAPPSATGGADVDESRKSLRTGFWITLGAGLASAGAAVYFGSEVLRVNGDLDPYRRFQCGTSLCGEDRVTKKPPLTAAQQKAVTDLRDEGSRAQALQWVFVGVGSAFGIASAYLLYKGYIDAPSGSTERANRGLRVFPAGGAEGGGILAEFDF